MASIINNLGGVLHKLGDLEGARAAYEHALKILEKDLPEDHPYIRSARYHLSKIEDESKLES